jgi:hypothetical protein
LSNPEQACPKPGIRPPPVADAEFAILNQTFPRSKKFAFGT